VPVCARRLTRCWPPRHIAQVITLKRKTNTIILLLVGGGGGKESNPKRAKHYGRGLSIYVVELIILQGLMDISAIKGDAIP